MKMKNYSAVVSLFCLCAFAAHAMEQHNHVTDKNVTVRCEGFEEQITAQRTILEQSERLKEMLLNADQHQDRTANSSIFLPEPITPDNFKDILYPLLELLAQKIPDHYKKVLLTELLENRPLYATKLESSLAATFLVLAPTYEKLESLLELAIIADFLKLPLVLDALSDLLIDNIIQKDTLITTLEKKFYSLPLPIQQQINNLAKSKLHLFETYTTQITIQTRHSLQIKSNCLIGRCNNKALGCQNKYLYRNIYWSY